MWRGLPARGPGVSAQLSGSCPGSCWGLHRSSCARPGDHRLSDGLSQGTVRSLLLLQALCGEHGLLCYGQLQVSTRTLLSLTLTLKIYYHGWFLEMLTFLSAGLGHLKHI